ncbi:hypothetical protein PLESTF_001327000 [Pleodorina starrii]|nr:hypothetical protein PLESTF_001327000 [Pleodorina starrii]
MRQQKWPRCCMKQQSKAKLKPAGTPKRDPHTPPVSHTIQGNRRRAVRARPHAMRARPDVACSYSHGQGRPRLRPPRLASRRSRQKARDASDGSRGQRRCARCSPVQPNQTPNHPATTANRLQETSARPPPPRRPRHAPSPAAPSTQELSKERPLHCTVH